MLKNIVLVGQPNAGKTTLFNTLTNGKFKTGNYPGITVEYHSGKVDPTLSDDPIVFYDTPGMNSLFPNSEEEKITVDGLFYHPNFDLPDLVVSVVDATQLSRQLYLTKQLIDCGFNVIVALTMTDTLKEFKVDTNEIERQLGVPVYITSGTDKTAVKTFLKHIPTHIKKPEETPVRPKTASSEDVIKTFSFLSELEKASLVKKEYLNERTLKIDTLALHPVFGSVIFFLIMGGLFSSVFWLATPFMDFIDSTFSEFGEFMASAMGEGLITDLVVNGLIAGIGAVVIFLPQIVILFLLMNLLEDSGYLARAAVIIDKPLSKIGLSGRAFVPLLSGYACAIPAMMSARTLKNPFERFIAIFIIPLMSCSARLPVYVIFLAILTPKDQPWLGGLLMLMIYTLSMVFASIVAAIIGRFKKAEGHSFFALELPTYKLPHFKTAIPLVISQAKGYLKEAGSVIIVISIIMWALSSFSYKSENNSYQVETIEHSILGEAGQLIEPVLKPMGLDWRCGVAIIASFSAREIFVGTLVQIFRLDEDESETKIVETLRNAVHKDTGAPLFTLASICSILIFYMFALLCFPTLVVAKKEMGSWKIPLIQFFSYTGIGYILSVIVYGVMS